MNTDARGDETNACARARRLEGRDRGFTLIELLVVVIIVGILAGIAIPVYLNQRKKAVDASLKADLKNAAIIAQDITNAPPVPFHKADFLPVGGNTSADVFNALDYKWSTKGEIRITGSPAAGTFQLCGFDPGGAKYTSGATALLYDNQQGGFQPGTVNCDGGDSATGPYHHHTPWQGVTQSVYGAPGPLDMTQPCVPWAHCQ